MGGLCVCVKPREKENMTVQFFLVGSLHHKANHLAIRGPRERGDYQTKGSNCQMEESNHFPESNDARILTC